MPWSRFSNTTRGISRSRTTRCRNSAGPRRRCGRRRHALRGARLHLNEADILATVVVAGFGSPGPALIGASLWLLSIVDLQDLAVGRREVRDPQSAGPSEGAIAGDGDLVAPLERRGGPAFRNQMT